MGVDDQDLCRRRVKTQGSLPTEDAAASCDGLLRSARTRGRRWRRSWVALRLVGKRDAEREAIQTVPWSGTGPAPFDAAAHLDSLQLCAAGCLSIQTTPAQTKRISFAQPRGLTKGYFCPHLVHQTACSLSRLGLSRALRRLAPHRHLPTGVEHFWQNRTFVASKHLRCTSVPLTLIQKVGPEYITPPTWNHGAPPGPRPAPRATVWVPTLRLSRSSSSAPCRSCRTWPASRVRRTA